MVVFDPLIMIISLSAPVRPEIDCQHVRIMYLLGVPGEPLGDPVQSYFIEAITPIEILSGKPTKVINS